MTGKRVLYQEPQATFFHDVMTNLFTDKMTKAATYYNLHPSNSELMSWGNNAPKIKDLLQLSGVTDTYVTFEYLVPYNMKRIDCILYGRNSQNQGNVVHIELKQWDNKGVRDTDCEGNFNVDDEDSDTTFQVQAYTGGGHRLVSHPSQQVRGYNDYLTGFIEVLSSKELHIEGLAYCYNYRKNKTPNTLFDEKYSELLQAYKTYAGDEVQELAQHLQQALGNGDGETIFHKMISSPIRPSKKLLESAANLIHEGNVSAFALIEEQIIARNVILDKIRKIGNKKSIIIVKGGPGTGKTVIKSIILPDTITEMVGGYVFYGCSSLETVHYPVNENITEISASQFWECSSLIEINISEYITSIGQSCFSLCKSMKEIEITDNIHTLGKGAFFQCESLENLHIPSSITSIPDELVRRCYNLTHLDIPERVTSLGIYAIAECTNMEYIIMNPVVPPTIVDLTFNNTPCKFYVPDGSLEAYKTAGIWSKYASRIYPLSQKTE